jgi:hypothetical protein
MATPSELALVQDMDAFRYATLRFLLQEKSLSWVSIWNPTFATLFLNPLEQWFDQLVEDIRTGSMSVDLGVTPEVDASIRKTLKKSPRRAKELVRIRERENKNFYEEVWPNLRLISCWAHGNSGEAVKQLQTYFPNVAIQPKGLIATEAFVSFPLRGGNKVNPTAAILSGAWMVEYLGEPEIRNAIFLATEQVINEGKYVTYDIGGTAKTSEMADAIAKISKEKLRK